MKIDFAAAGNLHSRLPASLRLATLSPEYVQADASRSPALQPVYWCYREAESFWYHGFHLIPLPEVSGFDIISPYGYGGPVSNSDDPDFLARAWAVYVETARSHDIAAEFVRFHPLAQNERFYGGEVQLDRQTVWMNLESDNLFADYQTRVRTAIRKGQKAGTQFRWADNEEITSRFAAFYRAGMAAISAAPFYFFEDAYFAAMARMPATRLAVCHLDDEWLSAGLFLLNGDCVEYHLAASSEAGKRLSASNLLLHEVALSAKRDGYLRLYLGGGTDIQPCNPLYFFKSGFSSYRAPFKVGSFRHDLAVYEALRKRWADLYAANPEKMMFYR
jgi:hypothetical protein